MIGKYSLEEELGVVRYLVKGFKILRKVHLHCFDLSIIAGDDNFLMKNIVNCVQQALPNYFKPLLSRLIFQNLRFFYGYYLENLP
jgi:hypothetical protein